jgi:8-oxo-dGTP pyrophosphatase MutT (NUDIX family)
MVSPSLAHMTSAPVTPRPAATVLLVRDHPQPPPGRSPLQVFLQQRVTGMAFAGGMTVFPGGGVDASDRPDPDRWAGPEPRWWAERLGVDVGLAGALVHAAVRETFEECGVLLAGPGALPDLHRHRADVVARRRMFSDVLAATGLVLRADLLHAWARWITPLGSPRRYDTAFFVARVPDGQQADAHTTEAVAALWWHPDEALQRWQDEEIQLMAPTVRTLQEIAEFGGSAAVLAAAPERVIRPIVPVVRRDGDRLVSVLPDDTAYPAIGLA